MGTIAERAGNSSFVQAITKLIDGKVAGVGRDPYKYPTLPYFAGAELAQIIDENDELMKGRKITQPAFAAHSVHDTTVKINGIIHFLEHHAEKGMAIIISEDVSHSSLVLEHDVALDESQTAGPSSAPKANPNLIG